MPAPAKAAQMDEQVMGFLDRQLPETPQYKESLVRLWKTYVSLGLPNAHFVKEFTSSKREAIFQRGWEMMLARHLDAQGHRLTSPDHGPDFRFEHDGLTVWVEAISPEPKGLPADWMTGPVPGEFKVGSLPQREILLRWTAAFKEKWDKLQSYRKNGIVREGDAYVIAINGCQLGAFPLNHGISQFPFAAEAVYCVGPLAVPVNTDSGKMGQAFITEQNSILNANAAPVPTSPFVDPAYEGVSAIIACSMDRSDEASLPIDVIHNHFARVRVPERILGSEGDEWVTDPVAPGDSEIELRKLGPLPPTDS
jgi:type I restriction enzyme S subunit